MSTSWSWPAAVAGLALVTKAAAGVAAWRGASVPRGRLACSARPHIRDGKLRKYLEREGRSRASEPNSDNPFSIRKKGSLRLAKKQPPMALRAPEHLRMLHRQITSMDEEDLRLRIISDTERLDEQMKLNGWGKYELDVSQRRLGRRDRSQEEVEAAKATIEKVKSSEAFIVSKDQFAQLKRQILEGDDDEESFLDEGQDYGQKYPMTKAEMKRNRWDNFTHDVITPLHMQHSEDEDAGDEGAADTAEDEDDGRPKRKERNQKRLAELAALEAAGALALPPRGPVEPSW